MSVLDPDNSFDIVKGASRSLQVTLKTGESTYYDLTGGTLYCTVKGLSLTGNPLMVKTSLENGGITILSARGGSFKVDFNPEDTQDLSISPYSYDLWLETSAGQRFVIIPLSTFNVVQNVTELPRR